MVPQAHDRSQTSSADSAQGTKRDFHFSCRGVDLHFTDASPFPGRLGNEPGIYAVLVPDENCQPAPFRILYFGQAADLATSLTMDNPRYKEWQRKARNRPLLVSIHPLPARLN